MDQFKVKFSVNLRPSFTVIDNFIQCEGALGRLRKKALEENYEPSSAYYKGSRTYNTFRTEELKLTFERILRGKIADWDHPANGMNGKLQFCNAETPLVYHRDALNYAGILYLTPDAPFSTGTTLYAHKETKIRRVSDERRAEVFSGGYFDKTKFETVDVVGNVYNRLVLFDATNIHAASCYFGKDVTDSRLFQIFFFNLL